MKKVNNKVLYVIYQNIYIYIVSIGVCLTLMFVFLCVYNEERKNEQILNDRAVLSIRYIAVLSCYIYESKRSGRNKLFFVLVQIFF